jgi:hypothetical protein
LLLALQLANELEQERKLQDGRDVERHRGLLGLRPGRDRPSCRAAYLNPRFGPSVFLLAGTRLIENATDERLALVKADNQSPSSVTELAAEIRRQPGAASPERARVIVGDVLLVKSAAVNKLVSTSGAQKQRTRAIRKAGR